MWRALLASMSGQLKSIEELERVGSVIVDSALAVHRALGPGLLESAYQACLFHELHRRGLTVECEVPLPVHYVGITVETGYRVDMIIEGEILVENKALQAVAPIHRAQLLTYLKMSNLRLGYLINWNVPRIKDGIKRLVNNL
jgi:GxxExxY protein